MFSRAKQRCRWAAAILILGGAVRAETSITLESEEGDLIGRGDTIQLGPSDGLITAARNYDGGVSVTIVMQGGLSWELHFAPGTGDLLPGPYEGCKRFPIHGPVSPGMSIGGDGRGCSRLAGRFEVHEIEFGPDTQVVRFAASFEQHCEGLEPALFGTVLFNASGPPFPPHPDEDGDSVPDTLDNCPDGANEGQADADSDGVGDACDPEFNNTSITFEGEPGDPIVNGEKFTLTQLDGTITAHPTSGGVTITFLSDVRYDLSFTPPPDREFVPGPYESAMWYRMPERKPPGLQISGDGTRCSDLTGRFDVLEVAFAPDGQVERFAATFEQRCRNSDARLLGRVFFNASGPPFPPPPDGDGDSIPDSMDNCLENANTDQADADLDGLGDACDAEFTNTWITIDSQGDHPVGPGRTLTLTLNDTTVTASHGSASSVVIRFQGPSSWNLVFTAPDETGLQPGRYETGLTVAGDGGICTSVTERFTVHEAVFGAGKEVVRFAASFEQQCEGASGTLLGSVSFNGSHGTQMPGDCNQDATVNVADAICTFDILFLGSASPAPCGELELYRGPHVSLLDWQADRAIDISDGIAILNFLFLGGRPHVLAPIEGTPGACVPIVGCRFQGACAEI